MKKCFKCGASKPLSLFYKHNEMKDGRLNKCKECCKKEALNNRKNNINYYREYDRKRNDLPNRIEARKEYSERARNDPEKNKKIKESKKLWAERNIIKRSAHIIVGNALRDGKLVKKPCCICGNMIVDAHHDDYTKPLKVKWLCRKHHADHHKKNKRKRKKK